MNDATIIGAIITATVTIIVGAFAIVKQAIKHVEQTKPGPSPECISRIIAFMDNTDRVLIEANRIQHTQVRYADDVRQEISHLRTEISEIKGMLR